MAKTKVKLSWDASGEPWKAPPALPDALKKAYVQVAYGEKLAVGVVVIDYAFHVAIVDRAAPSSITKSILLGGSHAAAAVPERIGPVWIRLSRDEKRALVYGAHNGVKLALDVDLESGTVTDVLPGVSLTAATFAGGGHLAVLRVDGSLVVLERGADGALTAGAGVPATGHTLWATDSLVGAVAEKKLQVFRRSGTTLELLGAIAPPKKTWVYEGADHLGARSQTESHRLVV